MMTFFRECAMNYIYGMLKYNFVHQVCGKDIKILVRFV